jgi:hypothetical protein
MFSEAIASIPGNKTFDMNIDFSCAFEVVFGIEFYIVAETLFLITCVVQAVAAIVEAAQSVDGFLASFLLGQSYALKLSPTIDFITWTPELCYKDESADSFGEDPSLIPDVNPSETADCTPFNGNGTLIITLGFVITTLIFLPLGRGTSYNNMLKFSLVKRCFPIFVYICITQYHELCLCLFSSFCDVGHLKETILVQIIAFSFMLLLLAQFTAEFSMAGFPYSVDLWGTSWSQLAGVVLFNYAYIVTVPLWLAEKKNDVNVNHIVWGASTMSSLIYVGM